MPKYFANIYCFPTLCYCTWYFLSALGPLGCFCPTGVQPFSHQTCKISHKAIITFQEDPFSWFIQSAKHMPVSTIYLSSMPFVVFLPQIVKHYRSKLGFVHFAVPCIRKMLNMRYHEWLNKYLTKLYSFKFKYLKHPGESILTKAY